MCTPWPKRATPSKAARAAPPSLATLAAAGPCCLPRCAAACWGTERAELGSHCRPAWLACSEVARRRGSCAFLKAAPPPASHCRCHSCCPCPRSKLPAKAKRRQSKRRCQRPGGLQQRTRRQGQGQGGHGAEAKSAGRWLRGSTHCSPAPQCWAMTCMAAGRKSFLLASCHLTSCRSDADASPGRLTLCKCTLLKDI